MPAINFLSAKIYQYFSSEEGEIQQIWKFYCFDLIWKNKCLRKSYIGYMQALLHFCKLQMIDVDVK